MIYQNLYSYTFDYQILDVDTNFDIRIFFVSDNIHSCLGINVNMQVKKTGKS